MQLLRNSRSGQMTEIVLAVSIPLLLGACSSVFESASNLEAYPYNEDALIVLARQGDANAQDLLGDFYTTKEGGVGPSDLATGLEWYKKAALQGKSSASASLARHSIDGKRKLYWLLLASKQGNPYTQVEIAWKYKRGEGFEQDNVCAYAWLLVARLSSGEIAYVNPSTSYSLSGIGKGMTEDELSRSVEFALDIVYAIREGVWRMELESGGADDSDISRAGWKPSSLHANMLNAWRSSRRSN